MQETYHEQPFRHTTRVWRTDRRTMTVVMTHVRYDERHNIGIFELTEPEFSMEVSKSSSVVSPVTVEINTAVTTSLKYLQLHRHHHHHHHHHRMLCLVTKMMITKKKKCWINRTVMQECCKGDDASQWVNGKFDPRPRPNPLTDRHEKLHSWLRPGYLPIYRNFYDPLRGFFCARNCASKICLPSFFEVFFPGSSNGPQPRPLNGFSRVIRQTTRFRARMCLFGVRKQKFNIYTP